MTLMGCREPRLRVVPEYRFTWGPEVVELAALAGLQLDPWQADALHDVCAESSARPGRWNTLENALIVGRQNGKGGVLEAYVLGCLFLFDDPLVMFSAHRFDTAREMFLRIKELITGCHHLSRRVRRVSEAHGKEGIELVSGQRIKFHARSEKASRGFSGDKTILDEAFKLDAAMMGAIMPTMSARQNPQIVYASSAGWEISQQLGSLRRRALAVVCARLRDDGLAAQEIANRIGLLPEEVGKLLGKAPGGDPSLCFLEWSAPDSTPRNKVAMADPALWAQANPALGIRITEEFVAAELRTMGAVEFARERLGVSDYPPDEDDEGGWTVIGQDDWRALAIPADGAPRPGTEGLARPAFSVDVRPDRSAAAIDVAFSVDGRLVVEVVNHRQGTDWVVDRVVELVGRYDPVAVAVDKGGPAGSLIPDLEAAGVEVLILGSGEVAQAYGLMVDAMASGRLAHLDQEPLNEAVRIADRRPLGERHTWDRRGAEGDISPLVAGTNALLAHALRAHEKSDPLDNIW